MKAFVVTERDGKLDCAVKEVALTPSESDDVLVRVEYSSVNFKDAMVASVQSRVRRVASLVGGVDGAGVVEQSSDTSLPVGTRVAVHGGTLGVARDGGFATFVYAPAHYLSPLPSTITTRDAMIIGTAGFTAMASVLALEDHGLLGGASVLVTGASGGVGSQALTYLARRGYEAIASTGSKNEAPWLIEQGATRVIGRDDVSDRPDRMLGSELWDGAIDCVGGTTLHQILRSLRYGGAVAASGLVSSADLVTTIYPFITRAVALLGIDAVQATTATRQRVWTMLGDTAPDIEYSNFVDRIIGLDELDVALEDVRHGATRGRILVRVDNE